MTPSVHAQMPDMAGQSTDGELEIKQGETADISVSVYSSVKTNVMNGAKNKHNSFYGQLNDLVMYFLIRRIPIDTVAAVEAPDAKAVARRCKVLLVKATSASSKVRIWNV